MTNDREAVALRDQIASRIALATAALYQGVQSPGSVADDIVALITRTPPASDIYNDRSVIWICGKLLHRRCRTPRSRPTGAAQ